MAKLQDTSVLDYARSNGIAFDFLSLNPLEHIDQFQLPHPTSLSLPPESHFVDYISSLHAFLEHEIKAEKLDIGKSDAQFLSTVIHQARAEVDIADILPRQETLKIEPPLLKADAELDLSSLKRQSLLSLGSIKVPSPESGLQHLSVEASQRDLFNIPNELGDRIKGERLECKKESLRLIQNARCDGISVHDIEGIQSELGQGRGRGENQKTDALFPFNFDASVSPSNSPKQTTQLPSPSLSDPLTSPPPHFSLLYSPATRDRVWLLGSSEIDDMKSVHSLPESCSEKHPAGVMDKSTDGTAMEVDHDGVQAQILESGTHDAQGQSSTDHSSVLFPIPDGSLERDGSQDHEPSQQDKPQISHSMQGLHLDSERQNSDPCESVPAAGENHGHQYDEAESDQSAAPGHSESPLIPHERDSPPWTNGQPSPPKRKHEGDEANQRKRLEPGDRTVRESTSQAAFTSLGSLDSFMETRGVKLQAVGRSPYFNTKDQDDGEQKESENSVKEETPEEPTDFKASQQVPQCHSIGQDPPILFLATALLKTHSRVVKSLEDMEAAPTLVFRDYNDTPGTKASPVKTPTKTNQAKASPAKTKPPGAVEADIIVSPSTGIILTTSQAITQVHLPGHKASPDVEGIAGINSPLRERVFRAARRYEQLYIFISQFMESKKLSNKSQGPTIDKRTSSALTSLTAFCNSARIYSTITPLLISSAPEVMAEWIMSLADKHAFTVTRPSSPSQFTPVNKRGIEALYTVASMESESNWELFLRQAGMNPFAALTTLGIMRKHEKEHLARPDSKNEYVFPVSNRRKKIRCLSKFMEMRPEQRRELVGEAIGHRVLKRVEDMIEQDWHCDWALDFEDEE